MKILITILISAIVSLIAEILLLTLFKFPLTFLLKVRNKKNGGVIEYWNWKKKVTVLSHKSSTRISLSVLAKIQHENKYLLIKDEVKNGRKDIMLKPLGGVIKISPYARKVLSKISYKNDAITNYSAMKDDFRIFVNIRNTKIINKILYRENNEFYKKELRREIIEELGISEENFSDIFTIHEQPFNMDSWMKTPSQSILNINSMDFIQAIMFNVDVKDMNKLNEIIEKNDKAKWIDLSKGQTDVATTTNWLKENKDIRKFKTQK